MRGEEPGARPVVVDRVVDLDAESWQRTLAARPGIAGATQAVITELRPLGTFATWQAERVIGDHDRNTLRLRLDPKGQPAGLEPGERIAFFREHLEHKPGAFADGRDRFEGEVARGV